MSDGKENSAKAVATIEQPSFLNVLAAAAESEKVDAGKLETLLNVQIRVMEKQAEIDFNMAMGELQKELPTITKKGRIQFKDSKGEERNTPFARYEDIDKAIRPSMLKHGFTMSYTTTAAEGGLMMEATLAHVKGHSKKASMRLPLDTSGSKNNLQAAGSTISYGKRYLLGMLLNIITVGEDDDGQGADDLINEKQLKELEDLVATAKADKPKFLKTIKCEKLEDLKAKKFPEAKALLDNKIRANKKKEEDEFNKGAA